MSLKRLPFGLLAVSMCACDGCGKASSSRPDAAAAEAIEAPVPEPDGLLAEAWVRTPDATWAVLQHDVGGAAGLLPPAAGDVVCTLAGVGARIGSLVDGKKTWY